MLIVRPSRGGFSEPFSRVSPSNRALGKDPPGLNTYHEGIMTRNRRHPFGVILNEMTAVGDEFAALYGRLAGNDAATFPLNVWHDENSVYVEGDLPGVDR